MARGGAGRAQPHAAAKGPAPRSLLGGHTSGTAHIQLRACRRPRDPQGSSAWAAAAQPTSCLASRRLWGFHASCQLCSNPASRARHSLPSRQPGARVPRCHAPLAAGSAMPAPGQAAGCTLLVHSQVSGPPAQIWALEPGAWCRHPAWPQVPACACSRRGHRCQPRTCTRMSQPLRGWPLKRSTHSMGGSDAMDAAAACRAASSCTAR